MSIWKCYYFLPRILSQKYGKQHGSRSLHVETIHRIIQAAGDLKFLLQTTVQRVSSEIRPGCKCCIQLSDDCSFLCASSFTAWQEKCFSSHPVRVFLIPFKPIVSCPPIMHHYEGSVFSTTSIESHCYPLKAFSSPGWTSPGPLISHPRSGTPTTWLSWWLQWTCSSLSIPFFYWGGPKLDTVVHIKSN